MKTGLSQIMKTKLSPLSFGHLPFSQREEKKAFTLVELIVVITILAILATIAFVSIQSYTVYARDSVRLSNLRTIESSLKIQYTQGGSYAVPDDSVNITASGTVIRKQGVFGKQALRTVKLNSDASEDPLTGESYDYIVDNNLSEYQLVGYMEGDEAYNNTLQAETFANTGSTLKTLGQDLGIVFSGGVAVHRESANVGNNIDIMNATGNLNIVFDEGDETGYLTGSLLFSNVYNRSRALLKNKELAQFDDSLIGYYDMQTIYSSGGVDYLVDFSKNGMDAPLYGTYYIDDGFISDNSEMSIGNRTARIDTGIEINLSQNDYTFIGTITIYGTDGAQSILGVHSLNNTLLVNNYDIGSDYTPENGWRKKIGYWHDVGGFIGKSNFGMISKSTGDVHLYKNSENIFNGELGNYYDDTFLLRLMNYKNPFYNGGTNGSVHEIYPFRIYNRALSEKEIKTVYGSTIN